MQLAEINHIIDGTMHGNDVTINAVSIDTRTLLPGDLYVAIKGEQFDGNDFVDKAALAQAGAAVVQAAVETDLPHIKVNDTHLALGQIAAAWRKQYAMQVVGITGSNGKTTVKEMTAAILAEQAPVLFTKGNLNNDIGVPLTLLRLNPQYQFAVIEMGANHPGEISYTSACAMPDVSLITNVGPAHIEGFGGIEGVAQAKGEIISGLAENGIAILNKDDRFFEYWEKLAGDRQKITFGLHRSANVRATDIKSSVSNGHFFNQFNLHINDQNIAVNIGLPGQHNVLNALAAAAVAHALGITVDKIKLGLEQVTAVTGRLQLLHSIGGGLVIDDTYNANPASLQAGLEVLNTCPGELWVVLGAFGELGDDSSQIHAEMGDLLLNMGIKRLFAIGSDAFHTVIRFGDGAEFFDNKTLLIDRLKGQLGRQQSILIKGSRSQKMEQVAAAIIEDYRV